MSTLVRGVVILSLLAPGACSNTKPSRSDDNPGTGPLTAVATVESLISDGVTGVMRGTPKDFPLLAMLDPLFAAPCWTKLRGAITEAYQFELGAQRSSYAVLGGTLPRAEVEACGRTLMAQEPALHVQAAGDALVVRFDHVPGDLTLAWRGGLVVAGSKDTVAAALRDGSPERAGRWRERIAKLPRAEMAAWRDDALLTSLLGVTTTSYMLAVDGAKTPTFTIRVIAHYATAGDAAIAARKLHAAEFEPQFAPPPELVVALKRMKVTQQAQAVEVVMDHAMFEQSGVDLAVMQAWIGGLVQQQQQQQ